jgi:hypothetical protein
MHVFPKFYVFTGATIFFLQDSTNVWRFTHSMFFTSEERFTLALPGDRFERPFEFLLSPDNVPTPFPDTISNIVQLLVPRRVSVCQRIEDVLTMCHELIVTHGVFPLQNGQPILLKLVTK